MALQMADGQVYDAAATDEDVLRKAREQIVRNHEQQQTALGGQAVPDAVMHGCDTTLSHMGLTKLPSELIDVIKNETSRLALDHNRLPSLSGLSQRLHECTNLRYLVLRNNKLREFPREVLNLPSLVYIDIKINRIETLPEDLSRLTNLRVMAVQSNNISRIPICVGQMQSLVHFNARRNPIIYPPKDLWTLPHLEASAVDGDKAKADAIILHETKNLKDVLQKAAKQLELDEMAARMEAIREVEQESEEDQRRSVKEALSEDKGLMSYKSDGNLATPRPTRNRQISESRKRFPVNVSVSGVELRQETSLPNMLKAPPVPARSFARTGTHPAGSSTALNRPTIHPLPGALGERNRSYSESVMSTSARNKRLGIVPRRTVEEKAALQATADNRLSHLRGLSDNSALQTGIVPTTNTDNTSPTSSVEGGEHRNPGFSRRLSSLPEGKRKSQMEDPYIGIGRNILYALEQVHTPLKRLIESARNSTKSDHERALRHAYGSTLELTQVLERAGTYDEDRAEEEHAKVGLAVRKACEACLEDFEALVEGVIRDTENLVGENSPQSVRTLMMLIFGSLVELRNSSTKLAGESKAEPSQPEEDIDRGRFLSPTLAPAITSLRVRDRTPQPEITRSTSTSRSRAPPLSRAVTAINMSRNGSSNSLTSSTATLQVSGVPTTRTSRSNTLKSVDERDEELLFEQIATKLLAVCELAQHALPRCDHFVQTAKKHASERAGGASQVDPLTFDTISERCAFAQEAAKDVKKSLAAIDPREPNHRSSREFWGLVMSFVRAYFFFADRVKEAYKQPPAQALPDEMKNVIKPLHKGVKDVSETINESPWADLVATQAYQNVAVAIAAGIPPSHIQHVPSQLAQQHHHASRTGMYTPTSNAGTPTHAKTYPTLSLSTRGPVPPPNPLDPQSATSTHSSRGGPIAMSGYQTPMPATPMSAALGHAVLATVPVSSQYSSTTSFAGLPTPALHPTVPSHVGLVTPTMLMSPSPGLGLPVPPMNLNVPMSTLASPTIGTAITTTNIVPKNLVSPSQASHGQPHGPPLPYPSGLYNANGTATQPNAGVGAYFPNSSGAGPAQQGHGYGNRR